MTSLNKGLAQSNAQADKLIDILDVEPGSMSVTLNGSDVGQNIGSALSGSGLWNVSNDAVINVGGGLMPGVYWGTNTHWDPGTYTFDQDPRAWCPDCSAHPGKWHEMACPRNDTADGRAMWEGPDEVNPGYVMCTLVEGDARLPRQAFCPQCRKAFGAGEQVMIGVGVAPPFHLDCLRQLVASVPMPDDIVNAQYEAIRARLLAGE